MTTFSWTGTASTDFSNAANWMDAETGAPAAVPGAQDTAELSGTGEITGTGTVSALDLAATTGGHSFYQLDGAFSSQAVSALGVLEVGGTGLLAGTITVGNAATLGVLGVLNATIGALGGGLDMTVSDGSTAPVVAELDVGDVAFSGPGSPGYGGRTSTLTLGNGTARVGLGTGQSGLLAIADGLVDGGATSAIILGQDGAAGTLDIQNQDSEVAIGRLVAGESGTGNVFLTNGGTVTLGKGAGPSLVLGMTDPAEASTTGTGVLTAVGGTITVDGLAQVGETGQGSLTSTQTVLNTQHGLVIGDAAGAQGSVRLVEAAWTDTGNVVVGNSGQGSLLITTSGVNEGIYGTSAINGSVQIGSGTGTGEVTLQGGSLRVAGNTVLGSSHGDTITLQDAEWNSSGYSVRLLGNDGTGPDHPGGDMVMLTDDGRLVAGFLSVGNQDTIEALQGGLIALGSSAAGTAASIAGDVILGQSSTLTALGNVRVDGSGGYRSQFGSGLNIYGGTATLTATHNYALTLAAGGTTTIQGGSLVAQGGILLNGGVLMLGSGGVVRSQAGGVALHIETGGIVDLQAGSLSTTGLISIDDSHPSSHVFGQGGVLLASAGSVLDSAAAVVGGLAVNIAGGSAQINAAKWTVRGGFDVGANGPGGILMANSAQIGISGALIVGGERSYGEVSTANTDAVIVGGTLSSGQTGISAASIVVGGDGSSISTGTLDVGTASARGSLGVNNGAVRVAGTASINGVVRLGEGGSLSALSIVVGQHSTVLGSGTLSGAIVDQGAITASHGALLCMGPITGDGTINVGSGLLQLGGVENVAVTFGNAGTIVTPSISDLAGTLSGWQAGDAILFSGQAIASDSYVNGTLSLFDSTQTLLGTETFKGALSAGNFVLSSEQGTATLLSYHG